MYTVYIQYNRGEKMEIDIIISNSLDKAIYEQIKEQIKNKIIAEELQTGEMLPSIRSLARDLRVSVITTKHAYEELEKEGFIETRPGQGCFVASKNSELIREEQLTKIEALLEEAIQVAKVSKIDKQEMKRLLDILMEEE